MCVENTNVFSGVIRMAGKYTVTLAKLIHDNGLEIVYMPDKPQE